MRQPISLLLFCVLFCSQSLSLLAEDSLIAAGATVEKIADGFGFTEGPAADSEGNLYFIDDPRSKIFSWNVAEKKLSLFVEHSEHANGMFFDKNGDLIVCEGGTGSIVSYDKKAKRTIIADKINGKRFNKPNDIWLAPNGGIYFTDPVYGREFKVVQGGEYVYYITPDRSQVVKVADDLQKPNGIIGTPDGKLLYVTDQAAGKVWRYHIQNDGTLKDKMLFADKGVDGSTIDEHGNIYITADQIYVFNPEGKEIQTIRVPETPANVCFGGKDRKTLFITARTSVYALRMNVCGVQ
jgi:gluconolactonase